MKNTTEGINRFEDAEERLTNLEDRIMKNIQAEQQNTTRIFKNEGRLRDF